jgi:hypothetical protein
MLARTLRIVKRIPIALGVCESCNMQFKSRHTLLGMSGYKDVAR